MTNEEEFKALLTALADAINEKAGTTGKHTLEELIEIVEGIEVATND